MLQWIKNVKNIDFFLTKAICRSDLSEIPLYAQTDDGDNFNNDYQMMENVFVLALWF